MKTLFLTSNIMSKLEGEAVHDKNFVNAIYERLSHRTETTDIMDKLQMRYQQYGNENFMAQFKSGRIPYPNKLVQAFLRGWDGRAYYYKKKDNSFPSGLSVYVEQMLNQFGHSYSIVDRRNIPLPKNNGTSIQLRPYQEKALTIMKKAKRGIIELPVATGKTYLVMAYLEWLGLPAIILLSNLSLQRQWKERLNQETNLSVGVINGSEWDLQKITIAMVPTLWSRAKKDKKLFQEMSQKYAAVIVDECHHAGSKSCFSTLMKLKVPYRFGVSATPTKRSDSYNMRVVAALGPILYSKSNKEMVDKGFISPVNVKLFPIGKTTKSNNRLRWMQAYKRFIVESKERNGLIVQLIVEQLQKNKQVLTLVRQLSHGEVLLNAFSMLKKYPTVYLQGKDQEVIREKAQKLFEEKKINHIIATSIFDEGIDIPNVDVLVQAAGYKAQKLTIQRSGRGQRKSEGKGELLIIDFIDKSHRLLCEHSEQRYRAYKELEYPISLTQ